MRRRAKMVYLEVDGEGNEALAALSRGFLEVADAVVQGHDVALTMIVPAKRPVPGRGVDVIGHLRVEMDDGE